MTFIETTRTARHEFTITRCCYDQTVFAAEFRPLNPKTGIPWQASHRIEIGADVAPGNWSRPIAFSTVELARKAVDIKTRELGKFPR